jgi:signal transduction histidine kinase
MVIWAAVEFCMVGVAHDVTYSDEFTSNISFTAAAIVAWGILESLWCIAFTMECMTRLKLGKFWRNTIIYKVVNFIGRFIGRIVLAAAGRLPQILNNLIAYFAVVIVEFIIMLLMRQRSSLGLPQFGFALWIIEKIILLIFVIYFSLCSAKIRAAGEALAKGDLSYSLDTSDMILSQKKHGENLNSIAQGINAAVEERMKSERLKTELITNVSHDLKTPLTSIINYSNLIVNETQIAASIEKGDTKDSEINDADSDNNEKDVLLNSNDRIHEYAEVLNRQSMRLKKLLEDLLEASKATTGNVELNMQPCDVGVMLTQTIGEYENKFEEKKLNLLVKQTEIPVRIMADGRHMWRIFDNLMNNIYKYAMENTRVYLTVEREEEAVNIIFRNISEYELDVSADELTERFTRGDKSRHMEGNGLGLSIAASLVNLQKGSMEISTDGDLFKVTLTFPVI